jgi:hypothetical protein
MLFGEFRVLVHDLCGRFTQNDQAHHHRLLGALVLLEIGLRHPFCEGLCVSDRLAMWPK